MFTDVHTPTALHNILFEMQTLLLMFSQDLDSFSVRSSTAGDPRQAALTTFLQHALARIFFEVCCGYTFAWLEFYGKCCKCRSSWCHKSFFSSRHKQFFIGSAPEQGVSTYISSSLAKRDRSSSCIRSTIYRTSVMNHIRTSEFIFCMLGRSPGEGETVS